MLPFGVFLLQTEFKCCFACDEPIADRFVIDVGGNSWHAACLRCCVCSATLDEHVTCFVRGSQVYCKEDYLK